MDDKMNKYLNDCTTTVIPLWTDNSLSRIKIERSENLFFKEYNLDPNKFYVTYSGNLGKGHSIETIVEVANILQEYNNIYFVVAGEGYKENIIKNLANKYGLNNILLLPYQEKKMFVHLINASDLGVVSIDEPNAYTCIPSKVFNLFGAGTPVLCIGKSDSELGKLVLKYNSGRAFEDDQAQAITLFIKDLSQNTALYHKLKLGSIKAGTEHTVKNAEEFVKLHIGNK